MAQDPTNDAFQELLLALFQLHGEVLHAADAMSADLGLSGARWQVMNVVARRPMTVSQIARRLSLARQSVQRTVDALRTAGVVELRPNPDDRRAPLVTLTPHGAALQAALSRRQAIWAGDCLAGVEAHSLGAAAAILRDLTERVRRATGATIARLPETDGASRPTAPGRRLLEETPHRVKEEA
ncbi:MAG: MarR family transcriptional regulator [Dehalococcoidia bacterium]|nr:MAG: MarR family transcriptional regulator [Dehalococcoidia bacterium]